MQLHLALCARDVSRLREWFQGFAKASDRARPIMGKIVGASSRTCLRSRSPSSSSTPWATPTSRRRLPRSS